MPLTNEQLLRETEELLEEMKDIEPLTPLEVCEIFEIRLSDFPRWALAQNERELEQMRAMRAVLYDRTDEKSVELVREIDDRIAEVRRSIRYWSHVTLYGLRP